MKARYLFPTFLVTVLLLPGCTTGFLYTHTVQPLDTDHARTQAVQTSHQGDVKYFQYYVSVTWDSNAIGDIAREKGMETIHYADLERISILGGLWQQFIVHVYGD